MSEDQLLQLQQQQPEGPGIVGTIIGLAFIILMIASIWKVFVKAGEPGWAVIVPIYNIIVLLKIAGKPVWWIILFLIPLVNFVMGIIVALGLAQNFGKSAGYGIGLAFLPFIFYPMLGFGDAQYTGTKSA
jgi:Family of unknown function (DUF5684)